MRIIDSQAQTARRVWAVYRKWVNIVIYGTVLQVLIWTDHNLAAVTLLVASLFAGTVYSYRRSKRATATLSGDLQRRATSAARIMTLSSLLAAVLLTLGAVLSYTRPSAGGLVRMILTLMALAFGPIILGGAKLAVRRLHTGNLVLWLRRFHGTPIRGVSFPAVLGLACGGLAIPITLQDDQYRYSSQGGFYRSVSLRSLLIIILALTSLVIASGLLFVLLELFASPSTESAVMWGAVLILVGPGSVALVVWMVWRQRSLGVFRLKHTNLDIELRALLRRLRSDSRHVPGWDGLVVIKVPDESWRAAVLITLEQCALVVIDVTELNDNLTWELSAAVTRLSPDKIVLAYAMSDRESEAECRKTIQHALVEVVGPELASRFPVFFYPDALGKSRLFLLRQEFVHVLHAILRDRLFEGMQVGRQPTADPPVI